MKKTLCAALALTVALGLVSGALAHAKLVKSDPPANGQASNNKNFELTFNEELSGKLSGVDLTDSKGGKIPATSMTGHGDKVLMVSTKEPLKPGDYTLAWHAVASDDGHRTTGIIKFSVK